jgi:hypothetical protein
MKIPRRSRGVCQRSYDVAIPDSPRVRVSPQVDKWVEFHYVRPKMPNFISIPSAYAHIKKSTVSLLLKEEYKDLLLQMGIEDLESFLKAHGQTSPHLVGRIPHFSVSLKDGKKMVIRRYSHGGWLRFFTRDLYFSGSRSFQELCLTEEIRSAGISTTPLGPSIRASSFSFTRLICFPLKFLKLRTRPSFF